MRPSTEGSRLRLSPGKKEPSDGLAGAVVVLTGPSSGLCPIPPLVTADDVAKGILVCAREPKPEVTFGRSGQLVEAVHVLTPGLYDRFLPRFFEWGTFGREPRPDTPGHLFEPTEPFGRIDGGWDRRRRLPKQLAAGVSLVVIPIAAGLVARARRC
jgi:hypothetical protein